MASAVETVIRNTITKGVIKLADFNRSRMDTSKQNPYLTGIHEPVQEERTLGPLTVTGQIPVELDGRYLRIGPNPVTPPDPAAYHWFIGDGMIHGVRLKSGEALWYRNRWVRSNAVSAALGEEPAPGRRAPRSDNANTNILGHGGSTWALVEAGGYPVRIGEDLETVAHDPFAQTLKGSFSAHPHLDPDTGEMHAICYDSMQPEVIRHVVVDPTEKVRREEPIRVEHGPSIHDCMITRQYVIILDLPVTFSMKRLTSGFNFPYAWNPNHQARIGLLPREGSDSDIIWCAVDPCYVFHPCNGFEDEQGRVILDVCVHDSMFANSTMGPDSRRVPFERWTIYAAARSVQRTVLDSDSQEFPRPNEAQMGKPYRYAYTMALPEGGNEAFVNNNKLFKHDLCAGTKEVHDFGSGKVPGEFVFVPRPARAAEDDGWLMGFVIDIAADTTDLVILDAARFEGKPQARVHIPQRVPPGFHGNWVPASG